MKKVHLPAVALAVMTLSASLLLKPAPAAPEGNFLGVGSCSTTACHGKSPKGAVRTSYAVWQSDPHSSAFSGGPTRGYGTVSGLSGPKAKDIAKNLGIADPTTDNGCLGCHAGVAQPGGSPTRLPLPATGAASLQDGVQCESCHGPGRGYEIIHARDHKAAVAKGMFDLLAPGAAGKQCLACHKVIDARYIKAGHPDQSKFNFDSYADSIKHWAGYIDAAGNYVAPK